jgi:AraC-like DNA-binding protein
MNATPKLQPRTLLECLSELACCPRAEGYACITARRVHGARAVDVERPTLAIVLQGSKQVQSTAQVLAFEPGDLFLMARRCRLDVINIPDPITGLYLTVTIPFCDEVLEAARLLWDEPLRQDDIEIARYQASDFHAELEDWSASLQAGRYSEARIALTALAVALCRRGHAALLLPPPPSLSAQLRTAIAAQPDRGWRSHHFETTLGISGATLRRRLAAEGTQLREVIAAARLACAMNLLYTTRWPVKTVAARVGYRSVSSFVKRFSARYGMEPGRIGNAVSD